MYDTVTSCYTLFFYSSPGHNIANYVILLPYGALYLFTYWFTAWSRVLNEKPTGLQLVKFPAFYGARRFITAFSSARHLYLS
jgi:hypothetical protein